MNTATGSERYLHAVRIAHTAIWLFFVACIIAIPIAAWAGRFDFALLLIGIVVIEVLVLAVNGWRCPLTGIAARFTDDRRDNFDIYLPVWLARHNKTVFGSLFVAGVVFTVARWRGWLP